MKTRLKQASTLICDGKLVAIPTETVYGLAADATNDRAVALVFETKQRPRINPLISHILDLEMAQKIALFNPLALKLAQSFWPGPLTLVLPRLDECPVSSLACAGLPTIALRVPDHPLAQELIKSTGRPLCAPSANPFGGISPTTADHVRNGFGDKLEMILDGGACGVGLESSIIKIEGDQAILLRPGGLPRLEIEKAIGKPLITPAQPHKIEAPGMLASHYAPKSQLRINVTNPEKNEAFLGFGASGKFPNSLNLSPAADTLEAAANLFAMLHQLDFLCAQENLSGIAVAPISSDGPKSALSEAIIDRLQRAAAPRNLTEN